MNDASAPTWFGPALPFLFAGMWLFVLNLLASMGGWRTLAGSYGTSDPVDGQEFSFQSAKVGAIDYNSCLRFVAGRSGLRIAVLLLFRPGHRPLLVPWRDISATEHNGWIFRYVDFRFAKRPEVRLRLSRKLAEALIEASGNAVRIAEAA